MRALLQRVTQSHVVVDGTIVGAIDHGWLVLLGVGHGDSPDIARWTAEKCVHLRGFSDAQGKMNRSVLDTGASMLIVSQFTLYSDCSHGRRPSFDDAAPPDLAKELYDLFCKTVQSFGVPIAQGIFQADMQVSLVNDGPVTLWVEKNTIR